MAYLRLIIISLIFLLPGYAIGSDLLRSAEQLAFQYRSAHDAEDYSRIEDLFYWEGVEQKIKDEIEKRIKANFNLNIRQSYVANSPTVFSPKDYKVEGRTYSLNLTPIGSLHVVFETNDSFEAIYFVGINDGKYYITQGVPKD